MFGNKRNKILEEQNKVLFAKITEKQEEFENVFTQVEESGVRMHADSCQVIENTSSLVDNAVLNIEEESGLLHILDDFSQDIQTVVEEYEQLRGSIQQQLEAGTALVEENKHYTTPAKYLTETPAKLRQTYQTYETQLEDMAEQGRKMGVMALNAAIEAGRMGENCKQFVSASENIRQSALEYEKMAISMKEELEKEREKIDELEDIIHHLVSLMKENNIGTTRLMKKCQETSSMVQKSSMRDFSEDMAIIRDKVVGMRNLDEEIAKCGERNKIQLNDIQEELQNQKKELAELESDVSYILDLAEEQLK